MSWTHVRSSLFPACLGTYGKITSVNAWGKKSQSIFGAKMAGSVTFCYRRALCVGRNWLCHDLSFSALSSQRLQGQLIRLSYRSNVISVTSISDVTTTQTSNTAFSESNGVRGGRYKNGKWLAEVCDYEAKEVAKVADIFALQRLIGCCCQSRNWLI